MVNAVASQPVGKEGESFCKIQATGSFTAFGRVLVVVVVDVVVVTVVVVDVVVEVVDAVIEVVVVVVVVIVVVGTVVVIAVDISVVVSILVSLVSVLVSDGNVGSVTVVVTGWLFSSTYSEKVPTGKPAERFA